jgi:hypothetical protein
VLVAVNELCYATAMCAVASGQLLGLEVARENVVLEQAVTLVRSLGAFTVLNYEELLQRTLTQSQHRLNGISR